MRSLSIPYADRLRDPLSLTRQLARLPVTLARLPVKTAPLAIGVARHALSTVRGIAGRDQQTAPPPVGPARPAPVVIPDDVQAQVIDLTPGGLLDHADLPLADYDHLTLGSLRARLPKLETAELVQLLDYERAHANRLPVVLLFENRLRKLGAAAAEPVTTS